MLLPKVSIVITCYNKDKYINESIQSALNQSYKNIEIVCVNDCSTDNSKFEIERLKENVDSDFVFIDNKINKGVIESRNLAIVFCSGEYILPLDGDDTLEPTFVEICMNEILNHHCRWVYTKARLIDESSSPIKEWELPEYNKELFPLQNCIPSCVSIFKKSDFVYVGMYKSYMKDGCDDHDLWLSFVEKGLTPVKVNECLFNFRCLAYSRSSIANNYTQSWRSALFQHHQSLYANNPVVMDRLFNDYRFKYESVK